MMFAGTARNSSYRRRPVSSPLLQETLWPPGLRRGDGNLLRPSRPDPLRAFLLQLLAVHGLAALALRPLDVAQRRIAVVVLAFGAGMLAHPHSPGLLIRLTNDPPRRRLPPGAGACRAASAVCRSVATFAES